MCQKKGRKPRPNGGLGPKDAQANPSGPESTPQELEKYNALEVE